MANLHRGEVDIDIDGKTFRLHCGLNAIAEAEGVFSTLRERVTFSEIVEHANKGSVSHIRALLWAMLRKYHRDLSLQDVGDLVDKVGLVAIEQRFAEVLAASAPDPKDIEHLGAAQTNPPQAQDARKGGTSTPFTRKRARSA